jgi:hypothetical protein
LSILSSVACVCGLSILSSVACVCGLSILWNLFGMGLYAAAAVVNIY